MGTTIDFIEYVCDQIAGVGEIRYKKMFGEYWSMLTANQFYLSAIIPCL